MSNQPRIHYRATTFTERAACGRYVAEFGIDAGRTKWTADKDAVTCVACHKQMAL